MQNINHYRALYYPAFEPNIKWLKSHLILVDEICRIIPKDAGYEASDSIKVLKDLMPEHETSIPLSFCAAINRNDR